MKKTLTAFFLMIFATGYSQNIKKIEQQLSAAFYHINHWNLSEADKNGIDPYDSLERANARFEDLLLKCISSAPETLTHSFDALKDSGVHIASSEDGKLRIYSWDTRTGGSMRIFNSVFQYQWGNKVHAKSLSGGEGFYQQINDITVGNKKYYLVQGISILSGALSYHTIEVFAVEQGKLNDNAKLIKTKTGIKHQLGYEVDLSSSANQEEQLPEYHISYDKVNKIISIPLVQANGKITRQRILYRFTGQYFEKQ